MVSICKILSPFHQKMLFAKFGWNRPNGSAERRFFNFVNVFSLFCNYLPFEKKGAVHLNKLETPSPKDALCQVWLILVQWFWRRRFLNFVNVFLLFRNYLHLEWTGPFIWTNLNPPHPRMLCAKFGWKWPSGSGEKDFFIIFQCIFAIL